MIIILKLTDIKHTQFIINEIQEIKTNSVAIMYVHTYMTRLMCLKNGEKKNKFSLFLV